MSTLGFFPLKYYRVISRMKEATADTVDSEEESGVIASPDASPSMVRNPEEKRAIKRECSFEDESQRPNKSRKISSSNSEKTAPHDDSSDGIIVIPNQRSSTSVEQPDPAAGCSKEYEVHFTKPDVPCTSSESNNSITVENKPSNNDTEEDLILPVELMNLSDDVLLIIMSNLKPTDLLNLSL